MHLKSHCTYIHCTYFHISAVDIGVKTSQRDYSFYNTVSLKNFTHFTNLNSFEIENNMLRNHSQKAFSVYKIFSKHVSVWCQEKHLHCTISWRPRTTLLNHFKSKCLYISVYLSFCFKDEARFYLVVWGLERLNNSLKVVHCLSLIKCFTIFHFNWNFSKFNYFLVFRYFHQ